MNMHVNNLGRITVLMRLTPAALSAVMLDELVRPTAAFAAVQIGQLLQYRGLCPRHPAQVIISIGV